MNESKHHSFCDGHNQVRSIQGPLYINVDRHATARGQVPLAGSGVGVEDKDAESYFCLYHDTRVFRWLLSKFYMDLSESKGDMA